MTTTPVFSLLLHSNSSSDDDLSLPSASDSVPKEGFRLSTEYCAICEVRLGRTPWKKPFRCQICMKTVCSRHSMARNAFIQMRICELCHLNFAKKKITEEIREEIEGKKTEIRNLHRENMTLKGKIEENDREIGTLKDKMETFRMDLEAKMTPMRESIGTEKKLFEGQNVVFLQLNKAILSQNRCILDVKSRCAQLHSEWVRSTASLAQESKEVQLLEREIRVVTKKLRFRMPNEMCPHTRKSAEQRDRTGELSCSLSCHLL